MRHMKRGRRLGRNSAHRKALCRNLLTSLFEHGKIITTLPKAKEYAPMAEKMITLAKRAEQKVEAMKQRLTNGENPTPEIKEEIERQAEAIRLAYFRRALERLPNRKIVQKIFYTIAPIFKERAGGYTQILHFNKKRLGDNAKQAVLKLVEDIPDQDPREKSREELKAEKQRRKERKKELKQKEKERREKAKQKEKDRKQKERERFFKKDQKRRQKKG